MTLILGGFWPCLPNLPILCWRVVSLLLHFHLYSINLSLSILGGQECGSQAFHPVFKDNELFRRLSVQNVSHGNDYECQKWNQNSSNAMRFLSRKCPTQNDCHTFHTFQSPGQKCEFYVDRYCLSSVPSSIFW